MKNYSQVAKAAQISVSMFSNIVRGRRRPSWQSAKRLANVTSSNPVVWLEGTPQEIEAVVQRILSDSCRIEVES